MPYNPHDASSNASNRHTAVPGSDTTSGSTGSQGEAAYAPTVVRSDAAAANVGLIGRDRGGRPVSLRREPASGENAGGAGILLVVVGQAGSTGSADSEIALRALVRDRIPGSSDCYVCGSPRHGESRFCENCGAAVSFAAADQSRGVGAPDLNAVATGAGSQLSLLGAIPTDDGDFVYFAKESDPSSPIVALVPRTTVAGAGERTFDVVPAIDAVRPSLNDAPAPDNPEPAPNVAAPPDVDELEGTLLDDKYRILRKLGQGGMGRVYDARHEQLRARRAIKVMHKHLLARQDLVVRFYEEARNAARIKHEHVATVHDFGDGGGQIYIAMEFIEGEALSAAIRRDGKLTPARTATIIEQTAAALDAAHALKIIHRDVKPDNIMLCRHDDQRDDVKVVDFGISKALNRSELTTGGSETQVGVVIGTSDYMSDEQRLGQEIDHRTDIYALGRTAVKMLFGELPDHAMWKEWSRTRVAPSLAPVLDRAFAPRFERYDSAGVFARDLSRALQSEQRPPTPSWSEGAARALSVLSHELRRPLVAAAVITALASVIAAPFIARAFSPSPQIELSSQSLRFDADAGVVSPPFLSVDIATHGKTIEHLAIDSILYDSTATGWLGAARFRNGEAKTPTALVIQPTAEVSSGTHAARVRVIDTDGRAKPAEIAVTLNVTAPDKCSGPRDDLARIRALTDPVKGTEADARRVVADVPSLLPLLCAATDRVEAQLRLAEAYLTLSQASRACEVLHRIDADAQTTNFAENVRLYLSRCP